MRRLRLCWICFAALLTMAAITATGASAELPEYKVCTPARGGQFSEKLCQTNVGAGAGKFELQDWTHAKKLAFKGKGGSLVLTEYIPGENGVVGGGGLPIGGITCTASKSTGAVTGPKTTEMTAELSGCKGGGRNCNSATAKKGVIRTLPLVGTLGYVDAGETKAGVRLNPAGGETLAEISCEGLATTLTGGVIGEYTPLETVSKEATYTFATSPAGEQDITGFNGAIEETFLTATDTPPGVSIPAGIRASATLKGGAFEVQMR